MNIRKEKEKEFFVQHMETFKKLGLTDPFFIIKTAFFQKGKFGRHIQLFESEISKGEDIYIEFYDNVNDANGNLVNVTPFNEDRQLFKYKANPFYAEEYDTKEGTNFKGEPYSIFTVPTSELVAVLTDGTEITYALYEKRKEEPKKEDTLPKLQNSLALFPDFEEQFPKKESNMSLDEVYNTEIADVPLSEMTLRDLAAIMLIKPVSARPWLNELIKQTKSEI
jgi:hypothetical protein